MSVDFDVQGDTAVAVYRALAGTSASGSKSKIAAGLLAIFLGGLGIHKFYLGYTGPGLVYLLTNTVGWIVTIFMLGLPNIALWIIALVEGIIYLTKSDEEFEQMYVVGRKGWF
jgi:TM2 domain-containing membrane protein YozV